MSTAKLATPLTLNELFDLEARLQRDRTEPPAELAERETAYSRSHATAPASPVPALLRSWLAWVYRGSTPPGNRYLRSFRLVRSLLGLSGVVAGMLAMAPLLHYDGTVPINVSQVLGVLLGLQVIVLGVLLYHLIGRIGRAPHFAFRPTLVESSLAGMIFGQTPAPGSGPLFRPDGLLEGGFATPLKRVYGPLFLGLTQVFGVGFNLGAILYLAMIVSFTDLAFSWSTTLTLSPAAIQNVTDAVSWPWAWLGGVARPTRELVEHTQYFRLGAAYAGHSGQAQEQAGQWWSFLLAATVTYGLLPRALILAGAALRMRLAVRRADYRTPEIAALLRRLGAAEATPRPQPLVVATAGEGSRPARAAVVLWRDIPAAEAAVKTWTEARQRTSVVWLGRAGGLAGDFDGEDCARQTRACAAGEPLVVVIVADQFEDFDKALRRFVAGLRQRLGATVPILIVAAGVDQGLLGAPAAPARLAVWRAGVASVHDRYLGFDG